MKESLKRRTAGSRRKKEKADRESAKARREQAEAEKRKRIAENEARGLEEAEKIIARLPGRLKYAAGKGRGYLKIFEYEEKSSDSSGKNHKPLPLNAEISHKGPAMRRICGWLEKQGLDCFVRCLDSYRAFEIGELAWHPFALYATWEPWDEFNPKPDD